MSHFQLVRTIILFGRTQKPAPSLLQPLGLPASWVSLLKVSLVICFCSEVPGFKFSKASRNPN
jgi:hypothetical protein